MSTNPPVHLAWYHWLAVALILLGQGTWIFLDARKRGERAWLWGLLGLVQFPSATIVYLIATRVWMKQRRPACGRRQQGYSPACEHCGQPLPLSCDHCGRPMRRDWLFCPYCGERRERPQ